MSEMKNLEYGIHIENLFLRIQFTVHPLQITPAGHDENEPWGLHNPHVHPYAELFFCENGSFDVYTEQGVQPISPGDILVIPAGVEHVRVPAKDNVRWHSILFSFFQRKTRGSRDLYSTFRHTLTQHVPLTVRQRHELTSRLSCIVENVNGNHNPSLLALSMADVLSQIIESLTESAPNGSKDDHERHNDVDIDCIARLESLVAHHYMKDLATTEVAKKFHISARQLDRISYRRYGATFRQAIINHRLKVAIEMFSATQMTIEEIGLAVGFSSRLSFSRAFAAQYGLSPQQYRKRMC